ncbi:MAG: AAA family ATPase [Candidatus Marinimicrobia bacterium]|nr:AAA family ATPase [Candidatus Neomarinimicrobiota bacterium]
MTTYGFRHTKKPKTIVLSNKRKEQLDNLAKGWNFEVRLFVKNILALYINEYVTRTKKIIRKIKIRRDGKFTLLENPDKYRDWQKRFIATGKTNSKDAYLGFLRKEITIADAFYLHNKIDKETDNVVLPEELIELFHNLYLVHLKGENDHSKDTPKKPFVLVVGPSGSGKTETIKGLIERAIFDNEVRIKPNYKKEREAVIRKHPFLAGIPFLRVFKPLKELDKLEKEEELDKKLARYNFMVRKGYFRKHFGKKIEALKQEEASRNVMSGQDSIKVHYEAISADEVQTKWYGETGKLFTGRMASSGVPSIRHILEAHSILGKPDSHSGDSNVQTQTLAAAISRVMDEIYNGERDCIFIADTHSPEKLAEDTYRRFDELGVVIDISKYWNDKKYLARIINLELSQKNIQIDPALLQKITDRIYEIFKNKGLAITPAYVRKLVSSVFKQKQDIKEEYFYDEILIRKGFENVARNSHGKLFKKVVKAPKEELGYSWDDYEGAIKEDFMEIVSSTLFRGGETKGVALIGSPGTGKTFLTQVVGATHPEITYISAGLDDLYEEGHAEQGIIKNLEGLFIIAKMLAPSMVVINEGDAVAKKRNTEYMDRMDKVTNKFLDILDGDESVKGTFTVMTTNLAENLDPAITRPGRLEVMSVEGKLSKKEIRNIIKRHLGDEPLDEDVNLKDIFTVAQSINNTPAGFVDFIKKLKDLRKTDFCIISEYKKIYEENREGLDEFIKFNSKVIIRAIEALEKDSQIVAKIKKDAGLLFEDKNKFYELVKDIKQTEDYPLKKSHLASAQRDLLKNPQKKAFREFDDFLSEELSSEPQVGKIVGAAYGNNIGVLVPINTTLVPRSTNIEGIIVTGATKGSALQQSDPTEMTTQSAQESLALNLHFFETLLNKNSISIDPTMVIGTFLEKRSIHHQIETVNYAGGGPSAGFALAINTLSVLLNIPVYHDFGITGAPSTRGTTSKKAGSSVMIGGEDKKSERVLRDLNRMFVPKKNYSSISLEHQTGYWEDGKIIIPVEDYSDVIPEVLYVKKDNHPDLLKKLNLLRIEYNKKAIFIPEEELENEKNEIIILEKRIRWIVEKILIERLETLYNFCKDPEKNKYLSLSFVFLRCSS